MKKTNLALGILGGAALGAILGVLFAPAKGSETREKIAQKGGELSDLAKGQIDELASIAKSSVQSLANQLANSAEQAIEDGKELLAEGKSKLNDLKKDVKVS